MGGESNQVVDFLALPEADIAVNLDGAGKVVSYTLLDKTTHQPMMVMEPAEFVAYREAPLATRGWYQLAPQWSLDLGSSMTYAAIGNIDKAKEHLGYALSPEYAFTVVTSAAGGILAREAVSARIVAGEGNVVPDKIPASFYDDLAASAARNPDSDKVMLGKFLEDGKSYTKVGAHYEATYFKLDDWRDLSKTLSQEDMWKVNESFLRQQITQGKEIIFSHDPTKATGFFAREVDYLEALGYTFTKENWVWKATR